MIDHRKTNSGVGAAANYAGGTSSAGSGISVADLAGQIGIPVEKLLVQFNSASIKVAGPDDIVADADKERLLRYLQQQHGANSDHDAGKIVLRRASTSKIKVASAAGGNKTVSVQVRRKRSYLTSPDLVAHATTASVAAPPPEASPSPELAPELSSNDNADLPSPAAINPVPEVVEVVEQTGSLPSAAVAPQPGSTYFLDEVEDKPKKRKKTKSAREFSHDNNMDKLLRHGGNLNLVLSQVDSDADIAKKRPKPKKALSPGIKVQAFKRPTAPMVYEVTVGTAMTVAELAQKMSMKGNALLKVLIKLGINANLHQVLDQETAVLVVEELGHKAKVISANALEQELMAKIVNLNPPVPRSPIVTIMGHVDHGKTTLLDYIRNTKVANLESGGITQHIGAYHVDNEGAGITFLDTPGHAAFTAMRARGAKLTDVVVLVVAADDGVMPQTIEALEHAKAAGVPIIVAITKADKVNGDFEAIKHSLSTHQLIPEEWGGETMFVPVSAVSGHNVDVLLDSIMLQAEMLQLTAPELGYAKGIVLESRLDKGRGPVATVLVQEGLLQRGDMVLAGGDYAKVRAMFAADGLQVKSAGPAIPVEVLGWSCPPQAGDPVWVVPDERMARDLAGLRKTAARTLELNKNTQPTLSDLFQMDRDAQGVKTLQLVIKADVHGSVEALIKALTDISVDEVVVKVLYAGIGGITETDVNLAIAAQAVIIGFNVRADAVAQKLMDTAGVVVRYSKVIYTAIEQLKEILSGYLTPEVTDKVLGNAVVREVFRVSKHGVVAGCLVTDGVVKRNSSARLLRDHVVVYEGAIETVRRFKDDVAEVRAGVECGVTLRDYSDIKAGDQLEVFERVISKRTLV